MHSASANRPSVNGFGGRYYPGQAWPRRREGMADTLSATRSTIGDVPKRREDARFVTGRGGYLDDLVFDRLTHAILLRSPHAHARITRLDLTAARSAPGVLAVLTCDDADADG